MKFQKQYWAKKYFSICNKKRLFHEKFTQTEEKEEEEMVMEKEGGIMQ